MNMFFYLESGILQYCVLAMYSAYDFNSAGAETLYEFE